MNMPKKTKNYPLSMVPAWCRLPLSEHQDNIGGCWGISTVFDEIHKAFAANLFYTGLHTLMDYINVDLSGIYMNAVKDRLYCGSGRQRDSAIAAMASVLQSMMTLIAPLFTYTAQEVFSYCPDWMKGNAKDIFDLEYIPIVQNSNFDEKHWKEVRTTFYEEFDKLKVAGIVKETLEVVLEGIDFFEGAEDWFPVSRIQSLGTATYEESLCDITMLNGREYRIVKSKQNKCERCWKRNAVEKVCERCLDNLS